jgi:predicted dehydrogenase
MTQQLRAGVVGAGVFGGHHARKYASQPGVTLTAIFDPDPGRGQALAGELGATACTDMTDFLALVDVVTVASPADSHGPAALVALNAGKHVYVEKPLAANLDEAEKLTVAAARKGLVLACGHQERIVFRAMGLMDVPETPLALEAVRRGIWNIRGTDVSCVLDLMIHDIDLALSLARCEPIAVEAEGRTEHGPYLDEVEAEATFVNGMTATFKTSRIAEARERTMRIVYPSGEVEIDFLTRAFRNTTPFALNGDFTETPQGKDPLGANVAGFLAAVRGEIARPPVTGIEAAHALDLALAVEQAAGG